MFELRPHLLNGARNAGELIDTLGISRGTLSNAYERETKDVLRIGRARATKYASRARLAGLDTSEFPVFRVNEAGEVGPAGQLVTLASSESVWQPNTTIIDGLPPEMHDIAPKGFLGRSYARRHNDLDLPIDVTNWSDNHVLIALSRRGEDLPGNLVMGRESFDRFQRLQHRNRTIDDFRTLANDALAGEHAGSSAGGEQPKFTALVDGRHKIVKFATATTDNARRWADLLSLEHLALETLREAGISAASTTLVNQHDMRYLVVDRFDRIKETGRRPVLTLAAASAHSTGSWSDAAKEIQANKELRDEAVTRIALLEAYGALIANTDRHLYNILLYPTSHGYDVAPAFDQLPMAYAPPASGNLRLEAIEQPNPSVNTLAVWDHAVVLARKFWRRAAQLDLTDSMKTIVREHAER